MDSNIDEAVGNLLALVARPGSKNHLSVADVREDLRAYIDSRSEDVEAGLVKWSDPSWELVAADFDPADDAVFVAGYFAGENATLVAARGASAALRGFAIDCPRDAAAIIPELGRRFQLVGEPISVDRCLFEEWLRSSP